MSGQDPAPGDFSVVHSDLGGGASPHDVIVGDELAICTDEEARALRRGEAWRTLGCTMWKARHAAIRCRRLGIIIECARCQRDDGRLNLLDQGGKTA